MGSARTATHRDYEVSAAEVRQVERCPFCTAAGLPKGPVVVLVQVEIRLPYRALTCCAAIEASNGKGGRSVGVRAEIEEFAGCGIDLDRGAVVPTELDLPHHGVAVVDVDLQRCQVAFSLLGCGVDGVRKANRG